LTLKLLPRGAKVISRKNGLEAGAIERAGLDELEETGLVLGASGLQGNGGEVFGREDSCWRSFDIMSASASPLSPFAPVKSGRLRSLL